MVDMNRVRGTLQQLAQEDTSPRPAPQQMGDLGERVPRPSEPVDTSREARLERFRTTLQNIDQQAPQQESLRPETIGDGPTAPTFGDAYGAGVDQLESSYELTKALVGDLVGNEAMVRESLENVARRDEISAGFLAHGTSFEDLKDDPSVSNALQFTKQTLGQLAPMALESAVYSMAGSLVGGPVGGGAGAVAGRTLLRKAVRDKLKSELADSATDAASNKALTAALRAQASSRGAYIGAGIAELRQGASETFRETAEAGDPNALAAIGAALPFAAIGFLPDKMIIDTLKDAVSTADPTTRNAIRNVMKTVGTQTGVQAGTELGQEEVLIRLRDALTEEDYAGSSEANLRRQEAAAAGAVGGTAIGGIAGVSSQAVQAAREMATGQVDTSGISPESRELAPEVESALNVTRASRDMQEEDTPMPESQADIDAQFNALMSQDSAKQAVEITDGSPMPSNYSPDMEDVIRVDTQNGQLLTTDQMLADQVQQAGGTPEAVAEALGYADVRQPGMSRAVIARDNDGNIVHSELISETADPDAAMQRARQYAPNVELQDGVQALEERAQRVRSEGRNPEMETVSLRMRKLDERMARLERSRDVLSRARESADFIDRWPDIERRLTEIRQESARTESQLRETAQAFNDLQARQRQQEELQARSRQDDAMFNAALREATADDPNVAGGIEAEVKDTGEVVNIPREVYEDLASRFRSRNEGENFDMTDAEVADRIADEFSARGVEINREDVRPIAVREVSQRQAQQQRVPERLLDPNEASAYRGSTEGINNREQVVGQAYRLGPQTEATIVDGVRVPVSAVRKLRKLRKQYPEDDWSLVTWNDRQGNRKYQVKRERNFAERGQDQSIQRDVEGSDSEAAAMTADRTMRGEAANYVTPDPTVTRTDRQRVLASAERSRWQHGTRQPPENFSLRMIDPQGREGYFDPNVIASAGMDANQNMFGNRSITDVERRESGIMTALAILHESGYKIYSSTIPQLYGAKRQRERRAGVPNWRLAQPDWDALPPEEKLSLLNESDISQVKLAKQPWEKVSTVKELDELTENDVVELPLQQFSQNDALLEAVRQRAFEIKQATQDMDADPFGDHRSQQVNNTIERQALSLARMDQGVHMDAGIHFAIRQVVAQAKKEAGINANLTVITDRTSRAILNRLPDRVREAVNTDPSLVPLVSGQVPSGLMGRTIFAGDEAVIWINASMSPAKQSLALAHELGHVSYREHYRELASDPKRIQRLTKDFEKDLNEGLVKQYQDPTYGFEEWYADRFAAWVHGRERIRSDGVARTGKFREIYNSLKAIANKLRVTASRLEAMGSYTLSRRLESNEIINTFLDGIVRKATRDKKRASMRRNPRQFERGVNAIRKAVFRRQQQEDAQRMRENLEEMGYRAELEAEMAQIEAEEMAGIQHTPPRASFVNLVRRDDPVFRAQLDRHDTNQYDGEIQGPLHFVPDEGLENARRQPDPRPRIDFTDELEPQPGAQDPAPRQDFTPEAEVPSDDPAPGQTFEREPQEGGGGAGQPPGGGEPPGGTTPPPGDAQPPFDPRSLYEAINGNARRWAGTETFDKAFEWIKDNLPNFMQGGFKAVRDLTFTDDARLRSHGPIGRRIANLFYDDTFDRNVDGPRGFLNAVEMELGHWINQSERWMPDDPVQAEQALREAQSGRPTSELSHDGRMIRHFLKRFYRTYLSKNVREINMRNDYFPRAYDMAEIVSRSDEFAQLIVEAGYTEQEAARIVHSMLEGESSVEMHTSDQEGAGPGMSARLARVLEQLNDSDLQQRGFLLPPRDAMMQYLRSAVRRAEYEKRFGGELSLADVKADLDRRQAEGRWVDEEFYSQVNDRYNRSSRPDMEMVYDPSARLKELIERAPEESRPEIRQIIRNYMGRSNTLFGVELPMPVARIMSTVAGAMYGATLGLAALSQITDFGAIVMRTRGTEGIGMLHRAISQVPRDERIALSKAVGSISHQMNLEALRMTYGNEFMTPGVRKFTDTFFRVIGLEQITNFSRSVATTMGAEFLTVHAEKAGAGDPRSRRYLEELRVTPQQVFEWQNNERRFEGESGEAVRQALFQFTDESILRPNAAMRPGWASNPWFTLMWQLKSFAWGFYKVVMRGLANEVRQRAREGAPVSDMVAPMAVTGAVMLPLAFTTMVLRDMAKEGLNSAFDDDEYTWMVERNRSSSEWMLELTDRAGLLGPWAIVNSAYDAHGWGDNPALTLLGPAAEKAGHVAQGDFSRTANDMLPVAGLVR